MSRAVADALYINADGDSMDGDLVINNGGGLYVSGDTELQYLDLFGNLHCEEGADFDDDVNINGVLYADRINTES